MPAKEASDQDDSRISSAQERAIMLGEIDEEIAASKINAEEAWQEEVEDEAA